MGLLRKVENVPNIDYYEYRDGEYYNKFLYRAKFRLEGIGTTHYIKTTQELLERINRTGYGRLNVSKKQAILANLDSLNNFIDFRNQYKKAGTSTFRIENDTASIYSNDLPLLLTLKNLGPIAVKVTEVQLEKFSGVKYYVNEPKHKFRIYLKSAYIKDKNFLEDLSKTIKKSSELVASSALAQWLKECAVRNSHSWRYSYTSSSHSIDYDNESTLSYLVLMYGDMLGKRYKLEKRPEVV